MESNGLWYYFENACGTDKRERVVVTDDFSEFPGNKIETPFFEGFGGAIGGSVRYVPGLRRNLLGVPADICGARRRRRGGRGIYIIIRSSVSARPRKPTPRYCGLSSRAAPVC
jgi:hypothetical protein